MRERRVLGLETEYVALAATELGLAPVNLLVLDAALTAALEREVPLRARAALPKGGHFLPTGGRIHVELGIGSFGHGYLELSTPECFGAAEAVRTLREQERLVCGLRGLLEARLASEGHPGRLLLAATTTDSGGHTTGTHESYDVEDEPGFAGRVLLRLLWPVLWLASAFSWLLGVSAGLAIVCAVFPLLCADGLRLAAAGCPAEDAQERLRRRYLERMAGISPFVETVARGLIRWLMHPSGAMIARLVFPRMRANLVPFLVTRNIFAGAGALDLEHPERPGFVLSARADRIAAVFGTADCRGGKPLVDLKSFVRNPGRLLARRQRLEVTEGGSNMSDHALWLRVGATELVVRALEAGLTPGIPRLQDPLSALRTVARDLSFTAALPSVDGSRQTCLAIQQAYLEMARRHVHAQRPDDAEAVEVLRAWGAVLADLQTAPDRLAGRVDWSAKLGVFEGLSGHGALDEILRVAPLARRLEALGVGSVLDSSQGDYEVARTIRWRIGDAAWRELCRDAAALKIAPGAAVGQVRQLYQLKKADLKYHELDPQHGYFHWLRDAGLVQGVPAACTRSNASGAPASRARDRLGWIVRLRTRGVAPVVSWSRVFDATSLRVVCLDDPAGQSAEPTPELGDAPTGARRWLRALRYYHAMFAQQF